MNKGTFGAFSGRKKRQPMVPIWESSNTVLSLASFHQVSHNLNFAPELWSVHLRPVTTDLGWTANAYELLASSVQGFDAANYAPLLPYITANVIGLGYATNSFHTFNGSGAFSAMTPASWRVIYRIFG